jgi:hypothetical protein
MERVKSLITNRRPPGVIPAINASFLQHRRLDIVTELVKGPSLKNYAPYRRDRVSY